MVVVTGVLPLKVTKLTAVVLFSLVTFRVTGDEVPDAKVPSPPYLATTETPVPPESPDLSKIKLIEYDFATYGSAATRNRILARWASEVKGAPK